MNNNNSNNSISYCSYNSVLVVNQSGLLKQLFTPFQVYAMKANTKQLFIVDEVNTTNEDKLIYLINGKYYYHSFFVIDIHF
jgi:hypothetical protein